VGYLPFHTDPIVGNLLLNGCLVFQHQTVLFSMQISTFIITKEIFVEKLPKTEFSS